MALRIRSRRARQRAPRTVGVSAGGMEYAVLGAGSRAILFLPGGPGSDIPAGFAARMVERQVRPYLDAGYEVWSLTRRRNMPVGHTVADMAADHAAFIQEQMAGRADVIVGQSYGGLIALHLAAEHPEVVGRVVIAGAAATIAEEGMNVDVRWAELRAAGNHAKAGAAMLEYGLPGDRWAWLRRLAGPVAGAAFKHSRTPPGDLLVEAEAETVYNARPLLARITVPVLLICGDADRFFPPSTVQETADGITGCTTITYQGLGHMRTLSSSRLPRDILAWLHTNPPERAAPELF